MLVTGSRASGEAVIAVLSVFAGTRSRSSRGPARACCVIAACTIWSCRAQPPDYRFGCGDDLDCPSGFRCHPVAQLCARASAPLNTGALPVTTPSTAGTAATPFGGYSGSLVPVSGAAAPSAGIPAPAADCGSLTCDAHAVCDASTGKPTCRCLPGFTGDGMSCADACATASCDVNAECTLVAGVPKCTCKAPYVGDGTTCRVDAMCSMLHCDTHASCVVGVGNVPECRCLPGYEGDGQTCRDVDECTLRPCASNATCTNTDGSFTCRCNTGYQGTGMTCTDDDECLRRPCSTNATCTNTLGSYSCKCNSGYDGDGVKCMLRDPCLSNPCLNGGICQPDSANTSYRCDCANLDYDGTNCERRINDCSPNPCLNGGSCSDGFRAFTCRCNTGFYGERCEISACDGVTCPAGSKCYPERNGRCNPPCSPNCAIGQVCLNSEDCTLPCCGKDAGGTQFFCRELSWCG